MTEPFQAKVWDATVSPTYFPEAQRLANERAELKRQQQALLAAGAGRNDPAVQELSWQITQINQQRQENSLTRKYRTNGRPPSKPL